MKHPRFERVFLRIQICAITAVVLISGITV